jgi:hypothetical protein
MLRKEHCLLKKKSSHKKTFFAESENVNFKKICDEKLSFSCQDQDNDFEYLQ